MGTHIFFEHFEPKPNNYYRDIVNFVTTVVHHAPFDTPFRQDDVLILDYVKTNNLRFNGKVITQTDILFVPVRENHLFEPINPMATEPPLIDSGYVMLYNWDQISHLLALIFQNHSDILDNKELSIIQNGELGIEILRSNPEIIFSILNLRKMHEEGHNYNLLGLSLMKLKILFDVLIALFGRSKIENINNENKEVRQEVVQRIHLTVTYMMDHLSSNIKLEELARIANFSPTYYAYVFTQVMHKSPLAFLIEIRMHKAKEILQKTSIPIDIIAQEMLGMHSLSNFYRTFKSFFGISPGAYRQSLKK